MDKIEEFEENNKVTKCEDSTRNTGTHLAWHKENHATRTRNVEFVYHDLHIIKGGVEYRLEQFNEVKASRHGYSYKAFPVKVGRSFIIMETQLKAGVSRGSIKIKKKQ